MLSIDDGDLLYISLCILFVPLWFLFSIYSGREIQIQGQLGLLTFARLDEACKTTYCLKDVELLYDVYR